MSDEEIVLKKKKSEAPPRRRPKRIKIPRRQPSVVTPERKVIFITPDKTTCTECKCFPKEEPYSQNKKINPCQKTPATLFELAERVVNSLPMPKAFKWSVEDVVNWMENIVGLPQYRECIIDNNINGLRLLMLEDPSKLPMLNICDFQHIKIIVSRVRQEYGMDFVRFARSIGLPPRRPFVHCTWFYSRTGPTWGIRQNWSTCDILKQMKIIKPEPFGLDHWDLVWYMKPDFPKTLFARTKRPERARVKIPVYQPQPDECREYLVPRKFKLQTGIPDSAQMIWMEKRPCSPIMKSEKKRKIEKNIKFAIKAESRLVPKKIVLDGLAGKDLILARRKMPRPKFFTSKNL